MIGSSVSEQTGEPLAETDGPGVPAAADRRKRMILTLGGAAGVVLLAVAAFLLTSGGGSADPSLDAGGGVATPTARSASPRSSASGQSPAASSANTDVRDPFAGHSSSAGGGGAAGGAGATVTVTPTPVTVTASPTATAAPALYLGLYGFSGARADFRVNDGKYLQLPGEVFATVFTYVSTTTVNGQTCAKVLYAGATSTLCPGDVKQLH